MTQISISGEVGYWRADVFRDGEYVDGCVSNRAVPLLTWCRMYYPEVRLVCSPGFVAVC